MPAKLYCFVDETGQDTEGRLFIVGVVITERDVETSRELCEAIERESGKGKSAWVRTNYTRKLEYIGRVLRTPLFRGRLFVASYPATREYHTKTVQAISRAVAAFDPNNPEVRVLIDALPKALERPTALDLRRAGLKVDKVRGPAREETEPLIRLADALCGLARGAYEGQENLQELLDWALRAGVVRDVS